MATTRMTSCALIAAFAAVSSTGCDALFTFDRELPVARGAIFGEAVRNEAGGAKAAYSQVNLMGVGLVRQASSEGVFALTDLSAGTYILRINDDDDGDGQPDRSRLVATSLVVADRPEAFGLGTTSQLVSTSLGEVVVEGTGTVSGQVTIDDGNGNQVPPADLDLGGRALIFRDIVTDLTGEQPLQLGADAETHVDAAGRYQFNKTLSGEFFLVVALHQGAGAVRNETVFISEPQRLTLSIGDSVTADAIEVDAIDANLEDDRRPVEVLVAPALADRGEPYAIFAPPGRALSTCQNTRPSSTQFAYERVVNATAASISRLEEAPLGVWDVRLCGEAQFVDPETGELENDVTLGSATLFSLVVPQSEDGISTVLTGPVVLTRELDPCIRRVCTDGALDCADSEKDFVRDCDGDGIAGLAPFDPASPDVVNAWSTCATQCGANTGLAAVEAECAVGGVIYDCDDDGDLQSDASEPPACYGPGLGDDRDGDGLCSGEDGYPTCAANTAAACEAGTNDVAPVVPEEFSGGEVGVEVDVFDLNFGDDGVIVVAATDAQNVVGIDVLEVLPLDNDVALLFTGVFDYDDDAPPPPTNNAVYALDPTRNDQEVLSEPLFAEALSNGVNFFPHAAASVQSDGQGVHFLAGAGTSGEELFEARLPHVCRATSNQGVVDSDTDFEFFGCTNAVGANAPLFLRDFVAVEIVNGTDACAVGAAPDVDGGPVSLYVQCYSAELLVDTHLLNDAALETESLRTNEGFDILEFVDINAIVPGDPGELILFSEFVGLQPDGTPVRFVSAFAIFNVDTGVFTTPLTKIELDVAEFPGVTETIVSDVVNIPGEATMVKLVGRAVSGGEASESDFFLLDFETRGVQGVVPASGQVRFESNGDFEEIRGVRVVTATEIVLTGGRSPDSAESDLPFGARWTLQFGPEVDGIAISSIPDVSTARSLEGRFSEMQTSVVIAGNEYLLGHQALDLGEGEIDSVELMFARLAPPEAGEDTAE